MATVPIDKEKVTRMVTATLKQYHDSGCHPGEVVIALGESLGRVIGATGAMGVGDIAQRQLLDAAIKQMTNAILVSRGEASATITVPDYLTRMKL